MASGGKRGQQAEQRRTQLIDTALALFSQRGVEATRVSDIAESAGVAQGLLYHYFSSKDELLAAIIERHGPLPLLREALATPPDRPTRETLLQLVTRLHDMIQERRTFARLAVREIIWRPETLSMGLAIREQALDMLGRYLRSRVEAGELRPHDQQVVGQMLAATVILVSLADLPIDPYLTGAIDVILQGIAVQPIAGATPAEVKANGD